MHDTSQLRTCCKRDPFISQTFLDVFAADKIPDRLTRPSCFIANTDPSHKPGQHWIAVILRRNGESLFLDSYGNSPTHYNPLHWRRLENLHKSPYDLQQETSTVCGDWCLYFLRVLSKNKDLSLEDVVEQFDVDDDAGNDAVIRKAIHRLYPDVLDTEEHPNVEHIQGCRSRR